MRIQAISFYLLKKNTSNYIRVRFQGTLRHLFLGRNVWASSGIMTVSFSKRCAGERLAITKILNCTISVVVRRLERELQDVC